MNLYVVRHGQTDWNKEKKTMGRMNIPLNENGKKEAFVAKEKLDNIDLDLIICSPLNRTKETAEIINENRGIPIIYDERIIERNCGEFEGTIETEDIKIKFWDYYSEDTYESAETMRDFFKRIYNFLDDIRKEYKGKNILLVTHGGIGTATNCYVNKHIPKVLTHLVLKNAEVAHYEID